MINGDTMKDEFIICESIKRNILYSLLSLIMVILCIFGIIVYFENINLILQIIMKIALFIGIFFFGYACIYFIKKIKDNKEMLIINNKGITDNTTAISFGFIPWKDIEDVYIDGVLGNEFIELKVRNEEKYLYNLAPLKKVLVNINKKMGHQIVCITLNRTKYSLNYVLEKINEYRKK